MFALVRRLDCLETICMSGLYAAILAPADAKGWARFCSVWDVSAKMIYWLAEEVHCSDVVN
jgi:hypothetical protein